ncbi:MAG: murein biosynthesis integral membrane protein MurJ, partial [Proteobacteria bacterium]|nr:murein biosynthesis integral membrane protein MurJ [Pseudomonadota bacterium]
GRHLLRLAVACALMVAVILAGLAIWPEWSTASVVQRAWRLGAIIAAAGGIYVASLYAGGLRLRDLRAT